MYRAYIWGRLRSLFKHAGHRIRRCLSGTNTNVQITQGQFDLVSLICCATSGKATLLSKNDSATALIWSRLRVYQRHLARAIIYLPIVQLCLWPTVLVWSLLIFRQNAFRRFALLQKGPSAYVVVVVVVAVVVQTKWGSRICGERFDLESPNFTSISRSAWPTLERDMTSLVTSSGLWNANTGQKWWVQLVRPDRVKYYIKVVWLVVALAFARRSFIKKITYC